MRLKVDFSESNGEFNGGFQESNQNFATTFSELFANVVGDYRKLKNKPSINGVTLDGDVALEDIGIKNIYYDTTQNWNSQQMLIGERGAIYIYNDHSTIEKDGQMFYVPGIKVGDGLAYLIDAPFVGDDIVEDFMGHVNNTMIHVSPNDRDFWNHKVSCFLNYDDLENLVFSKNNFVINGDVLYG